MGGALLCIASMTAAFAATITTDIGTAPANASHWNITSLGVSGVLMQTNAPAFAVNGGISFTSTSNRTGTCITGCSPAALSAFDGFWTAELQFTVPAGATNVTLDFSGLKADDRAVLELNGVPILLNGGQVADFSLNGLANGGWSGSGTMALTDGADQYPYSFSTSASSGTITTGFVTGTNRLTLIVNNTGVGLVISATAGFSSNTDDTGAAMTGTVTYNLVPEPASGVLLLLGLAPLAHWLRRRRAL